MSAHLVAVGRCCRQAAAVGRRCCAFYFHSICATAVLLQAGNHVIRMLNLSTGQLYLSAGTFTMGGDGGAITASTARFNRPRALAWDDRSDTLYFADCACAWQRCSASLSRDTASGLPFPPPCLRCHFLSLAAPAAYAVRVHPTFTFWCCRWQLPRALLPALHRDACRVPSRW